MFKDVLDCMGKDIDLDEVVFMMDFFGVWLVFIYVYFKYLENVFVFFDKYLGCFLGEVGVDFNWGMVGVCVLEEIVKFYFNIIVVVGVLCFFNF